MLQFVNEFTCSVDEQGKTTVIHFKQNEPVIETGDDGTEQVIIKKNDIASVVMDSDGARALSNLITQVLEENGI